MLKVARRRPTGTVMVQWDPPDPSRLAPPGPAPGRRGRVRARVVAAGVVVIVALAAGAVWFGSRRPGEEALAAPTTMAATTVPAPTTTAYPVTPLVWAPCDGGIECAMMTVPLDHAAPTGRTIDVAVARIPALDPAARLGSLVMNPGGPGGSGVAFLRGVAAHGGIPEALRARFDLVSFDPRGVAGTAPLDCPPGEEVDLQLSVWEVGDEHHVIEGWQEWTERCWESFGWLLPFVGTADVARDLDLLRAALGEQRLRFLGYSYGTDLGAAYASMFPDRVDAMVLDSALAIWTMSATTLAEDGVRGAERSIRHVLDECAADAACPFNDGTDPRARYDRLMAQLALDWPYGRALLLMVLHNLLYDPMGQRPVTLLLRYADEGDLLGGLVAVTEELVAEQAEADSAAGRAGDAADGGAGDEGAADGEATDDANADALNAAVYFAVLCADLRHPRSVEQVTGMLERLRDDGVRMRSPGTIAMPSACLAWPRDPAPPPIPTVPTATAVVVIGGRYDPATPYHWAENLAAWLPSAVLVTWDGDGHAVTGRSTACIDDLVVAYLVDHVVPPAGTACAPGPIDWG